MGIRWNIVGRQSHTKRSLPFDSNTRDWIVFLWRVRSPPKRPGFVASGSPDWWTRADQEPRHLTARQTAPVALQTHQSRSRDVMLRGRKLDPVASLLFLYGIMGMYLLCSVLLEV